MENIISVSLLVLLIGGFAYYIDWKDKKDREKHADNLFEEGSKSYETLQKEISKCRHPINIFACELQIERFIDNYYNHPCRAKYVKMLTQSLRLKEDEIIRSKQTTEYLKSLKIELS